MRIEVEIQNKSYGSKSVLRGIDMTFESGKIYGIVGRNGAGKTTFFKCLTELEVFDGSVITDLQPLRQHVAYLPTNPIFMSHVTGSEYLRLICMARQVEIDDFDRWNVFHLPLDEYVTHYSTGMKKKLAFIGILLQQSDVLILDEPFNGVDVESNLIILEILLHLRSKDKLILVSSHIFSSLKEMCDIIYWIDQGVIRRESIPQDFGKIEQEMRQLSAKDILAQLDLT